MHTHASLRVLLAHPRQEVSEAYVPAVASFRCNIASPQRRIPASRHHCAPSDLPRFAYQQATQRDEQLHPQPCHALVPSGSEVAKDAVPQALIGPTTSPEPSVLEAQTKTCEDRGERKEHLSANGSGMGWRVSYLWTHHRWTGGLYDTWRRRWHFAAFEGLVRAET